MHIQIVSFDDGLSGSGRASLKLNSSLKSVGLETTLSVGIRSGQMTASQPLLTRKQKYRLRINAFVEQKCLALFRPNDPKNRSEKHTLSWLSSGAISKLNDSDADILQLMFVAGLLSVRDIAKLSKPLVWRLSDMWALSGTRHYSEFQSDKDINRSFKGGLFRTLEYTAYQYKRAAWKRPISIVSPSEWLANLAKESEITKGWPITVIPTPIESEIFRPIDKSLAREILQIPEDAEILLFSALGGFQDKRKGGDILMELLPTLLNENPRFHLLVMGSTEAPDFIFSHERVIPFGILRDQVTLALTYSAADAIIIPSRLDNLPQVGVEAQSCGCPIITFNSSGLAELVANGKTGFTVEPFRKTELLSCINALLQNKERLKAFSRASRERSLRRHDMKVVGEKYRELYESILLQNSNR